MPSFTNRIDDIIKQIERNTRFTEIGFYGVSVSILIYACYRKRPFNRFVKATDIPNEFVKQKIQQRAILTNIEASKDGPLLLLKHKPPFPMPFFSRKVLPVRISGIQVDVNGFSWLKAITAEEKNKEIVFIPFTNTSNIVDAQVFIIKSNNMPLDLGKWLINIGFASSTPPMIDLNVNTYAKYYFHDLKRRENLAKFFRRGQWSSMPDKPFQFRYKIEKLIWIIKTQERKVPFLVRNQLTSNKHQTVGT